MRTRIHLYTPLIIQGSETVGRGTTKTVLSPAKQLRGYIVPASTNTAVEPHRERIENEYTAHIYGVHQIVNGSVIIADGQTWYVRKDASVHKSRSGSMEWTIATVAQERG